MRRSHFWAPPRLRCHSRPAHLAHCVETHLSAWPRRWASENESPPKLTAGKTEKSRSLALFFFFSRRPRARAFHGAPTNPALFNSPLRSTASPLPAAAVTARAGVASTDEPPRRAGARPAKRRAAGAGADTREAPPATARAGRADDRTVVVWAADARADREADIGARLRGARGRGTGGR